jgi:hypothetical protein
VLVASLKPAAAILSVGLSQSGAGNEFGIYLKHVEGIMGDYWDRQHGVNDPVGGVDVKPAFHDNKTPHERAQTAADVRADPSPASDPFLPEALRRPPAGPLNKRTGRNPSE